LQPNPSPYPNPSPTPNPIPTPTPTPGPSQTIQAAYISGVGIGGFKNLIDNNILPQEAPFNVLILAFLYPLSTVIDKNTQNYYPQTADTVSTFTLAYENGFASSTLPSYYFDNEALAWMLAFQKVVKNGVQNRVLFSVGGAAVSNGGSTHKMPNPYPLWAGHESMVAGGIATFIKNFQAYKGTPGNPDDTGNQGFLFDGIDIDFEDTQALHSNGSYKGQDMLIKLTQALRQEMVNFSTITPAANGNVFNFISHAPQAPYMSYLGSEEFGAAATYYPIINAVGNIIDLYNIQFYSNLNWTGAGPMTTLNPPNVPFPIANTLWGLINGQMSGGQSGNLTLTPVPISKIAIGACAGLEPDVTPDNIVDQFGGDSVVPNHKQFSLMFWTQPPAKEPTFSIGAYVGGLVQAFYA
jgi:hypothetical protein